MKLMLSLKPEFFFNFSTFFEHFSLSLLGFLFYLCIFFISTIKSHSLRQDTKILLFCFPHQLEYCTLFSEFLYEGKFSVPSVAQVRSSLLLCYIQHMVGTFNIHLITHKIKLAVLHSVYLAQIYFSKFFFPCKQHYTLKLKCVLNDLDFFPMIANNHTLGNND